MLTYKYTLALTHTCARYIDAFFFCIFIFLSNLDCVFLFLFGCFTSDTDTHIHTRLFGHDGVRMLEHQGFRE